MIAELFTGQNPHRPYKEFTDPVELDAVGFIPGAMAPGIANLINRMLIMDPNKRDSASRFIDPWQGVFLDAIKRAHALEGRVF